MKINLLQTFQHSAECWNVCPKKFVHLAIRLLKKIPRGKVVTYKELARVCKTSPRAIGRIMARNSDPVAFPCYKVVASSGDLLGYSGPGGLKRKQQLLERDGVQFRNGSIDQNCFYKFPYL